MRALPPALVVVALLDLSACDGASRPGDTRGVQTFGQWEWHGRLFVQPDSIVTLVHMRIDTAGPSAGGDVILVRYEFNPTADLGTEYSLTLGFDLGRARDLRPGVAYSIGTGTGQIPGFGTVACLCSPLRPDSLRGTLRLVTRGMRQLTGRVDATLYLTEWNDASRHATYLAHQRFDAIK